MSDIKILGKNSDFRVVKIQGPVSQTVYSLSAYAIENVDHETAGKHYTRRHYQVKLYADRIIANNPGAWQYMGTLTLHLSGQSDTYVLQQQTADTSSDGDETLMLDWKGTIGQGDSLSMQVKRIDGDGMYNAVFYIMIA